MTTLGSDPSTSHTCHPRVQGSHNPSAPTRVTTRVGTVPCTTLVERELRAALDPGDHLSPLGLSLQTAINVAVEAHLSNFNPNSTVVEAPQPPTTAAVPINLIRTGTEDTRPRQVHMAPHPGAGPHPEDSPMYLPEVQGVTRGPTDKDPASYDQYRRHPRHETENLAKYGETENRSSYRHGPKSRRTRRGQYPEEEEESSEEEPYGDRKAVRPDYRPCRSRAKARRRGGQFPSDGSSPDSTSDEGRRHPGSRRDRSHRRRWSGSEGYSTDPEPHDRVRRPGRSCRTTERSAPTNRVDVIKPLNELFTKAVNYKTYRLARRSAQYNSEVARHISRIRKKLDVQMKSHTFSGQDPIAILGFLARFKRVCDHNGVSQGAAVWCFQFYLTGQAHALLQSRLIGNTMAVDSEQRDMLESYEEVFNFLLRTYATDEIIAEAYTKVVSFRQSSNMTEESYSNQLWDRALRCGTVFSDRRLKSLYVEGLLPATCAQVRNYLATHATVDYQAVSRYEQAIGETHRSARRQLLPSNVASRDARQDCL